MKYTQYFLFTRQRSDRSPIALEWIARGVLSPDHESVQKDGRIRRWKRIDEAEGWFLRVVLPDDGETGHNALFDRSFSP